jgi:GNAT superfamily N-acetyltransferase
MTQAIEIRRLEGSSDLRRFVRFPWRVYRGDPNWVPPLISERLDRLSPELNAFHSYATVEYFMAYKDGKPAGTIAAFVNHRLVEHLGEKVGGFGFFEMVEDYDVAKCLLDAACKVVRDHGMEGIRGPTNFGDFEEPGVLVDGFDTPPVMLEAHTPPYYGEYLERYGMTKYRDSYAWRVYLPELGPRVDALPAQMLRVFDAARDRGDVKIRKLRADDWDNEVKLAHDLFDTTLRHLPDYIPIGEETFRRFADQFKPFLDADLALFAEVDGETAGFFVGFPDINQVLKHLNGRMYPVGWLKFLWYIRRVDTVSFKLLGVLERFRRRGIDIIMYLEAIRAAAAKGYQWLDGSLTSEFNPTVVRLAERMGAERYKLFRLYQKMF